MKTIASLFIAFIATTAFAGDIVIHPTAFATNTGPLCVGGGQTYAGYCNYIKPISQGWGWAPDTNGNTLFTATYTNSIKVVVQSLGKEHVDTVCGPSNSVQIANPPIDSKYRFTVFFKSVADFPAGGTNDAGLVLHNFLP